MATADPHIQSDWENREFIQNISYNIKKISDFLNKFGMCVKEKEKEREREGKKKDARQKKNNN
jgi:hypothetical protein